jgi:hypothetical protein
MRWNADIASAVTFRQGAGHASPSGEWHVGFAGLTLPVCEPVMGAVPIDTDKFIMSHVVLEDSGYSLLPGGTSASTTRPERKNCPPPRRLDLLGHA